MDLGDRERFVKLLCARFGLDSRSCWKSFAGNQSTTGLLARAKFYNSPAGLAHKVGTSTKDRETPHQPDSPHQRAWLQTWLESRKNDNHKAALTLISIYLASLTGTQTVERIIGLKKNVATGRTSLRTEGLETSEA